ncbi:hypothetical protein CR513_51021, partial [Mucuna pruriens]
MKSSRPERFHLSQTRLRSPMRGSRMRSGPMALSMSTIQLRGHISYSSATTSLLEKLAAQVTQGSTGLRLGSRSLPERTDWDYQRTLVDLILNAHAIRGEPPPSTMAIVVEDGITRIRTTAFYNPTEVSLEEKDPTKEFTNVAEPGGMTRSGRTYTFDALTKKTSPIKEKGVGVDNAKDPTIGKEAEEFLKLIQHSKYKLLD